MHPCCPAGTADRGQFCKLIPRQANDGWEGNQIRRTSRRLATSHASGADQRARCGPAAAASPGVRCWSARAASVADRRPRHTPASVAGARGVRRGPTAATSLRPRAAERGVRRRPARTPSPGVRNGGSGVGRGSAAAASVRPRVSGLLGPVPASFTNLTRLLDLDASSTSISGPLRGEGPDAALGPERDVARRRQVRSGAPWEGRASAVRVRVRGAGGGRLSAGRGRGRSGAGRGAVGGEGSGGKRRGGDGRGVPSGAGATQRQRRAAPSQDAAAAPDAAARATRPPGHHDLTAAPHAVACTLRPSDSVTRRRRRTPPPTTRPCRPDAGAARRPRRLGLRAPAALTPSPALACTRAVARARTSRAHALLAPIP
ncbi:hypothetical protein BS78_05G047900 [Paspalum vaginatum]|nr:hypothetical protein BS78_05G047900 [Paspalum vaginatum]